MCMEIKVKLAVSRVGRNTTPIDADPYSDGFSIEAALRHADTNLERTLNTFRMAGEAGADLVVSIEDVRSIGNFGTFEKNKLLMELIEEIPGPVSNKVAEISRKYNMYTATNYCERDGDKCYNTTLLIDRKGEIVGKYRKVHLPPYENWYTTPGNEYPVFETDIGKIGFVTCHDIAFPEHCRIMALNGADIILHATGGWGFVINNGALGLELLQVRAAENCVYIATAYDMNKMRPGSSSCIISNKGDLLAENKSQDEDGIAIAEFTPNYALIDDNIWNFFAGISSERMRIIHERMPETYKVLLEKEPPLIKDCYPQHKHAKTFYELKDISRQFDEIKQNEFINNKSKISEKKL